MSRPTIHQIADRLDVSSTTVSRVLSGQARRYRISRKTEAAIRELARTLEFVPSPLARGLRLNQTLTVGLLIPDISNPFFASIARQVTLGAREHGYSVVLSDSQENQDREEQLLTLLRHQQVEGVIVCPVGQSAEPLEEVRRAGLPMVVVDRIFPGLDVPSVSSDNAAGARQATEHLIQHGHRRIVCLQGLPGTSPNELRLEGYRQALASAGLECDETLIVGDSFGEESGYRETKRLLETRPDVTAIFALSNLIALGTIRALNEAQRRVPEDISLVAFDDQPYAAYLSPPLTTVAQSFSAMGEAAVGLLFEQLGASPAPPTRTVLLPTTLIPRGSVRKVEER